MDLEQNDSRKRILAIEDDDDIREMLVDILGEENYSVHGAENGQSALNFLKSNPKQDLILLDLMMPVMNGWEFAEAIQKDSELAKIPIIVVSAYSEKMGSLPAKTTISKPIDINKLLVEVKKACGDLPC